MITKLRIRKHEVGLWFRHGDFKQLLMPGAYWLPRRWFGHDRVEIVNRMACKFLHPMLDTLVDEPTVAEQLVIADLKDDERALVWKNDRLDWIIGVGRHAFWKAPGKIEIETFNVNDFKFTHPKLEAIVNFPTAKNFFEGVRVESNERVLLFRDGELYDQLDAGLHVYWKNSGDIERKIVDLREQVSDVAGQEIMTADKVTLRVNLVVTYQVTDPVKAITVVSDHAQALYREAQLALRESVGARPLDKLLTDKDQVGNEIRNALASRADQFGIVVRSIGLRDIILPGDMKAILNEVILAQKQAEANFIRRREDTAAARSQANTAKLLAENPTLARMREMEAIGDVLKGVKATFVLGKGNLVEQIRSLTTGETNSDESDA